MLHVMYKVLNHLATRASRACDSIEASNLVSSWLAGPVTKLGLNRKSEPKPLSSIDGQVYDPEPLQAEKEDMSVFGGDSWAREAQQRKRRIDELMLVASSSSSYKQLSNGKYACLVCPNNPLLDSPLMLSMHCKGSRHIAAESRLKEKELMKQEDLKKRIALSNESTGAEGVCLSRPQLNLSGKPLIERTRKAAFETLQDQTPKQNSVNYCYGMKSKSDNHFVNPNPQPASKEPLELPPNVKVESGKSDKRNDISLVSGEAGKMLAEQLVELQKRREKELKFTAAGWKRDCHGRWFRDENVEFDSDEEDPNVSLT